MTDGLGANWFAYIAILAWPLVALVVYSHRPFAEATAWAVLGAILFLPSQVGIKIPMIPAIDKTLAASLAAAIGCFSFAPRVRAPSKRQSIVLVLSAIFIISPVVTSSLNNDIIFAGDRAIPGVGYYDGVSALLGQAILIFPFFVGRRFITKAEDIESLLRVLVFAGLTYSIPMLFEIRMSPRLSEWIYGVFSSTFAVEMRYGGFRPVVFMINGLATAFFLTTALLSATAFWRTRARVGGYGYGGISTYLGIVLILCKSAGALVYGVLFGALVRWFTPRVQMKVAVILAAIAISYPLLRMSDLVPTNQLLEVAAALNKDREGSLKIRFDQEKQLLDHASERLWFGWGRYGRSRVYDERGNDISITDGEWIIIFGQFGLFGFLAQFGLLTWPVFYAARTVVLMKSRRAEIFLSCLALIVALTAVEQLPNASISSWSWLLAGSLFGISSSARAEVSRGRAAARKSAAPDSQVKSNYLKFAR